MMETLIFFVLCIFIMTSYAMNDMKIIPSNVYHTKTPIQTYVSNYQNKPSLIRNRIQPSSIVQPAKYSNDVGMIQSSSYVSAPSLSAAIESKRFLELVSYSNQIEQPIQPQIIEVDAITAPVQFVFRSSSGPLLFQQIHIPSSRNEPQHTRSEEPAQLITHEVYKPIIQELREIIQPYRHVTQEIKPVMEEVRTVIAHSEKQQPITTSEVNEIKQRKQSLSNSNVESNQQPNLQTIAVNNNPNNGIKTIQQVSDNTKHG
uniref:Uncharacterized protein LOC113788580 n=1 Tax=Dermatophagoides pteronyssinus TaxID=6956 RepID=A0A6P6XJY6_DERPT|nr:uncharacterized protein LOC113788580 [Dermatophagoides pteronyssinus]